MFQPEMRAAYVICQQFAFSGRPVIESTKRMKLQDH